MLQSMFVTWPKPGVTSLVTKWSENATTTSQVWNILNKVEKNLVTTNRTVFIICAEQISGQQNKSTGDWVNDFDLVQRYSTHRFCSSKRYWRSTRIAPQTSADWLIDRLRDSFASFQLIFRSASCLGNFKHGNLKLMDFLEIKDITGNAECTMFYTPRWFMGQRNQQALVSGVKYRRNKVSVKD